MKAVAAIGIFAIALIAQDHYMHTRGVIIDSGNPNAGQTAQQVIVKSVASGRMSKEEAALTLSHL